MRIKKIFYTLFLILVLITTGCTKNQSVNNSTTDTTNNFIKNNMPDIVFLTYVTSEYGDVLLTFWDNNGNYFSCDEINTTYPFLLHIDELIDDFNSNSDKYIKHEQICDVNQLQKNYEIVCEIARNTEYDLIYPDVLPDVEARSVDVYGFYYDENEKLQYLRLHSETCMTQIYANDERANEVYEWYMNSIKID